MQIIIIIIIIIIILQSDHELCSKLPSNYTVNYSSVLALTEIDYWKYPAWLHYLLLLTIFIIIK